MRARDLRARMIESLPQREFCRRRQPPGACEESRRGRRRLGLSGIRGGTNGLDRTFCSVAPIGSHWNTTRAHDRVVRRPHAQRARELPRRHPPWCPDVARQRRRRPRL